MRSLLATALAIPFAISFAIPFEGVAAAATTCPSGYTKGSISYSLPGATVVTTATACMQQLAAAVCPPGDPTLIAFSSYVTDPAGAKVDQCVNPANGASTATGCADKTLSRFHVTGADKCGNYLPAMDSKALCPFPPPNVPWLYTYVSPITESWYKTISTPGGSQLAANTSTRDACVHFDPALPTCANPLTYMKDYRPRVTDPYGNVMDAAGWQHDGNRQDFCVVGAVVTPPVCQAFLQEHLTIASGSRKRLLSVSGADKCGNWSLPRARPTGPCPVGFVPATRVGTSYFTTGMSASTKYNPITCVDGANVEYSYDGKSTFDGQGCISTSYTASLATKSTRMKFAQCMAATNINNKANPLTIVGGYLVDRGVIVDQASKDAMCPAGYFWASQSSIIFDSQVYAANQSGLLKFTNPNCSGSELSSGGSWDGVGCVPQTTASPYTIFQWKQYNDYGVCRESFSGTPSSILGPLNRP